MSQSNEPVYVALLTPRQPSGALDLLGLQRQIEFACAFGVLGFALNGATGEFPGTSERELEDLLGTAMPVLGSREILCCIGSPSLQGTLARARLAKAAGAHAVLLPMPYFFPYSQTDLIAFGSAVADSFELPILLYNLPQFTSSLEVGSVLELMRRHSNIIGIKDSSGSLQILQAITEQGLGRKRMIGNDGVLSEALRNGLCDAVVSGVACVLPDLIGSFFRHAPNTPSFNLADRLLREFMVQLDRLPTPWGLKAASAARGITAGDYPLPLSADRRQETEALQAWLVEWLPALSATLEHKDALLSADGTQSLP
jgi:4-hydroxy-tetrahydrodipicolinate synthase